MISQLTRRLTISKKKLIVIGAAIVAFTECLITHLLFLNLEYRIHDTSLKSFESEAYQAARYSDIDRIKNVFSAPCDVYLFDSTYDLLEIRKGLDIPVNTKNLLLQYMDDYAPVTTFKLNKRLQPDFAAVTRTLNNEYFFVVVTSSQKYNPRLYNSLLWTSILVVIIAVTLLFFFYLYYHYKRSDDYYRSEYNKKTHVSKKIAALHKSIALLRDDVDVDITINSLLANLCTFYKADSSGIYLITHESTGIKLEYEWCREGVSSSLKNAREVALTSFFVDENTMVPIQQDSKTIGYLAIVNPQYGQKDLSFLKTMSTLIFTELLRVQQNDVEHRTLRILATNFMAASFIDFYTDELFTYRLDDSGTEKINITRYYSETIGHYIDNYIAEEDRERCHLLMTPGNIMKEIQENGSYSISFIDITSGEPRNFQTTYTKANNKGTQVVLCTIDNTKILKTELENQVMLKDALLKAEEASKAKSSFLFNMSHDIRTPMNAILGFTRMAQKNAGNKEKVLENLNKLNESGEHMLSLINDILDMSRAESGKIVLSEVKALVYDFNKGIEPMLQELAEKKHIDLSFVINDIKDPYVYLDKMHLNSCLINLISNAIKYSNDGCYVTASVTQIEPPEDKPGYGWYKYVVEDNGIGMNPEYLEHIFEPFSRERSSTTSGQQGTGLGLSITKKYIEAMGGTISVESKIDVGSKFTVIVPLKIQKEYIEEQPSLDNKAQEVDLSKLHIILADDNDLNREIALDLLLDVNINVDEAVNGQEILNLLEKNGPDHYDLILMDIQMPVLDGYGATRQIRKVYSSSKIPIIALSANAFEEDRNLSLETGMNEHLSKPIDPEKLYSTIKKFAAKN